MAGFHAQGLQLVSGIGDDASFVGPERARASSLRAAPTDYSYFAEKEGAFLVTSHGATFGSDGSAGNSANGMFAVVNVEPKGARFYRSQVTEEEMRLCSTGTDRRRAARHRLRGHLPDRARERDPRHLHDGVAAAGTAFLPVAQDPTALAVPFPASGWLKLVAPACRRAPRGDRRLRRDARDRRVHPLRHAASPPRPPPPRWARPPPTSPSPRIPARLVAAFPAAGFVTLSDPAGVVTPPETLAYTLAADATSLSISTAPALTWPSGATVQLTDAAGVPSSVSLALARTWPAGTSIQDVDADRAPPRRRRPQRLGAGGQGRPPRPQHAAGRRSSSTPT